MSTSSPSFRHTIEKSANLVRVTLPSRITAFRILFFCVWFLMLGYMMYGLAYIARSFDKAIELGKNSTPPIQPGGVFVFGSICFSLFFLALLALGLFGTFQFGRLVAGQEVIEATPEALIITRKWFHWKRSRTYSSEKIGNLRPNPRQLFVFSPAKRVERLLAGFGMIVFEYEYRTYSFGSDISETEAKQIIVSLQEVLPE